MGIKCEECNKEVDSMEFLFRHLRTHKISSKDYILKWKYGGQVPPCACGCNGKNNWNVSLRDFTKFIHGHHATGRIKSDEEKAKIGKKNSENMKRYLTKNRDVAIKKIEIMNSCNQTDESKRKRRESVHKTYDSMTQDEKQKFSDHTKKLWNDGTLVEAHSKASETFKQRFASGEYNFTERNDKISAAITQRYLDGGFEWSTGQYTSVKTGITCNYRSSWERELMELLDSNPIIETWKYEPMSLAYVHENQTRRYIPDFQVVTNNQDYLVEVKPPTLTDTQVNEEKRRSAIEFCERNGWRYVTWSSGDGLSSFYVVNQ